MAFVQIIEYETRRFDEVKDLVDKFRANSPGATMPGRGTVTKDRDRPNTYVTVVEFESYEKAMENSNRPETSEMAAAMAALCDGPPVFRNLDVIDRIEGQ